MVSEKKGRGSGKLDGRGVIRTEADEGEKGGKNLVGGEEGKSLYGGASERATKQAGSSPPAAVRVIGRGGDDAPPSLCGTSAESSLSAGGLDQRAQLFWRQEKTACPASGEPW